LGEQTVDANPYEPDNQEEKHHYVLVFDHEGTRTKMTKLPRGRHDSSALVTAQGVIFATILCASLSSNEIFQRADNLDGASR
jgi:hypothetical protein